MVVKLKADCNPRDQMNDKEKMVAEILSASASAYAAYATGRLFERKPEVEIQFGKSSFQDWKAHFSQRINELSVAIAENEPALFESQVRCARESFVAREVPENVLQESLICLGEILEEELPSALCQVPAQFISASLNTFDEKQSGSAALDSSEVTSKLAMRYLLKVLEGDGRAAIDMILVQPELGLSLEKTYQVLLIAQREIGGMWQRAEVSIAEEHLVTSTTSQAITLLAHHAEKQKPNGLTMVSAAVDDNIHSMGIRVVSDFFEFAGWRAIYLGSDLPPTEIALAVNSFHASLLLLSATISTQIKAIRTTIDLVRDADLACKIMVGGRAFDSTPDLWRQLGADAYAASPSEAVATASVWMQEGLGQKSQG